MSQRRKSSTPRGEAVGKPRRPIMVKSFGQGVCEYCKRAFEKQRAKQKYDTDYCRSMHWQARFRRKDAPLVTKVDGKKVVPFVLGASSSESEGNC